MILKYLIVLLFLFLTGTALAQQAPEGLFIASRAPDFRGVDQNGRQVRLKELLKKGKVVLVFYRGQWCPHCSRQLKKIQDSLMFIQEKAAAVVAVSWIA